MDYSSYPSFVVEDIVRLRERLSASNIPDRITDRSLIIGSWNLHKLGRYFDHWTELEPGDRKSPKRNLRSLAVIAEVIKRYDVIALQEIMADTSALRFIMEQFLGMHWAALLTDVTSGDKGLSERLAFIYDTRRVTLSGLSGELVLKPASDGLFVQQFDRTPYMVGFRAAGEHFTLLTAHIRYGENSADRLPEIRKFAQHTAEEIRDRTRKGYSLEEPNLIVLGDFNIDKRVGNPLFDAFIETGLWVPESLRNLKTTAGKSAKYYDQIAWFRDDFELRPTGAAGTIDFAGAVFPELSLGQMSHRVSDHLPLWVELATDRSEEAMASTLGISPDRPKPFG